MKKILFLSMLTALVGFTSCNKSDDGLQPQTDELTRATFSVQSPTIRATVTGLSRYIVEAYEAKDLTTTPIRVESSTGSLTVTLKKNTEYTFLFWADFGKAASGTTTPLIGYYNTDKLQEVSVVNNTLQGERAYCLAVSFNSKDFEANKTVVLKNAVAQVNLIETVGLTAAGNTVTITYPSSTKFNVATGAATEVAATPVTHTFTGIVQVGKDSNIATDYILAPQGSQAVANISVQLNSEPKKDISNVPFECNYKTNIKGEYSNLYSAEFTISNEVGEWGTPDLKPEEPLAPNTVVNTTKGNLKAVIEAAGLQNTETLIIQGPINGEDTAYLNGLSTLKVLDLSGATVWGKGTPDDIAETENTLNYKAFFGNKMITTVILPEELEAIGDSAFEGCTNLTII